MLLTQTMKHLICLLLSSSIVTTTISCSPNNSTAEDTRGLKAQGNVTCLEDYQVCVGDSIIDVRDWLSFDDNIVTEVVPADELSRQDREYIASLHGESARRAEETLRKSAHDFGARIFAESKSTVIRQTSYFEKFSFSRVYRKRGCAVNRATCVGDQYLALDNHQFVQQELVAAQITDLKNALPGSYLVRNLLDGQPSKLKVAFDLMPVTTAGCSVLGFSKHRFCVGDVFFPIASQHSISEGDRREIIGFTVPAAGESVSPIVKIYTGFIDLYAPTLEQFKVYIADGCVRGAPDFCPAKIAGETLLWVNGGLPSDVYTTVSDVNRMTMLGIAIDDIPSADGSALFHQDTTTENYKTFSPEQIRENFYRTVGCGTSKKICVGDNVTYFSEGYFVSMEVIGYSSASDRVIGKVPAPDHKYTMRTIAIENLR